MKPVAWLASVTSACEARLALAAGADLVDAKNPAAGALGALPMHTVLGIVGAAHAHPAPPPPRVEGAGRASHVLVSATVGDLRAMDPLVLRAAALDMAATGVDIVKLGLFPAATLGDCIDGMAAIATRHMLVGVLFADQLAQYPRPNPMHTLLPRLAAAGWYGVMLDTVDKHTGDLLRHCNPEQLAAFIALARQHGLHCGLAGSLRVDDIPRLLPLAPDMLGFRGALCNAAQRTAGLDAQRLAAVAQAMRQHANPHAGRSKLPKALLRKPDPEAPNLPSNKRAHDSSATNAAPCPEST